MLSMDIKTFNTQNYQELFNQKKERIRSMFSHLTNREIESFTSLPIHYRMRAEFRVWHDGADLYFYMFDKETKERVRTDQFPAASELINSMMIDLISEIKSIETLRKKLFQVDFLSTLSGEILVTLLYHRELNDEWRNEACELKNKLGKKYKVNLIGRAKKQKIEIDNDFVIEVLNVDGKKLIYKQTENSFTQPNANVAIKMLEWAIDCTKEASGDLLELYCGNGNFSIALARNFNKVLATELSSTSVHAANYNIEVNGIDNLKIIRMSAEEFSDAMAEKREYQRLKGINLKDYQCETIFVDPPRSGLDIETLKLVQQYKKILYVSCNPNTLLENLSELSQTHQIKRIALFDQFPYTDHAECGVLLERLND